MQLKFRFAGLSRVALLALCHALAGAGHAAPGGAGSTPAARAFSVVSATKDGTHPHFGQGSPVGFQVDGVQGRELVLTRGRTYRFDVDTGVQHDFYLSTDPAGWGVGTLVEGVEGNFIYKGVVSFTPGAQTPDEVYYQCRNHPYMGGTIHVVDPGKEGSIKLPERSAAPAGAASARPLPDRGQVHDRLRFADMFIVQSHSAQRIAASDNAEAKAELARAGQRLAAAKQAFDADRLLEAQSGTEEAIALMNEATRRVPSQAMQDKARSRYQELVQGVASLRESYVRNHAAMLHDAPGRDVAPLDMADIDALVGGAAGLSQGGKYFEANELLAQAQGTISTALNKILARRTLNYTVEIKSRADEYEQALARFAHFEELIPKAVEQTRAPESTLALMRSYVASAREKRDQAMAAAGRRDFAAAVDTIQQGVERLEQAIRVLGVPY